MGVKLENMALCSEIQLFFLNNILQIDIGL